MTTKISPLDARPKLETDGVQLSDTTRQPVHTQYGTTYSPLTLPYCCTSTVCTPRAHNRNQENNYVCRYYRTMVPMPHSTTELLSELAPQEHHTRTIHTEQSHLSTTDLKSLQEPFLHFKLATQHKAWQSMLSPNGYTKVQATTKHGTFAPNHKKDSS